jgi:hypothetical protein
MKRLRIAVLALALSTGLGACGGAQENPRPTVTVTAQPTSDSGLTESQFMATLSELWEGNYTDEERATMCQAVQMEPERMIDSFMHGAESSDPIMRGWVAKFFYKNCTMDS